MMTTFSRRMPAPHTHGEKRSSQCGGTRRVYMSFMLRSGWHCQFLEEDLKTALPKKLAFLSQDMIFQLARCGGASLNLEAEQAIQHGINIGRGGIWLNLTDDQYKKLK